MSTRRNFLKVGGIGVLSVVATPAVAKPKHPHITRVHIRVTGGAVPPRQEPENKLTLNPVAGGLPRWSTNPNFHHTVPNDPAGYFAFAAWNMGRQSAKIRRIELTPTVFLVHRDYQIDDPFEFWTGIESTTPTVSIISSKPGPVELEIISGVASVKHAAGDVNPKPLSLRLF